MEEGDGSLLYEALHHHRHRYYDEQQHQNDDDNDEKLIENKKNASCMLIMDVYLLALDNNGTMKEHLQSLASLGVSLNKYFFSKKYPWMSGGDGPVFGIHTTTTNNNNNKQSRISIIPHLRAVCRYNVSVADEWYAIGLLLSYNNSSSNNNNSNNINNNNIVMECWDVEDGQILLIEAAEHLPEWVDTIGPQHCRHRCWIRNHQVHLIVPPPEITAGGSHLDDDTNNKVDLSLHAALECLQQQQNPKKSVVVVASPAVQDAIRNAVQHQQQPQQYYHRAVVVVPRSVARLLVHQRPDLVAVACRSFVQAIRSNSSSSSSHSNNNNNNNHQQQQQQPNEYLVGECCTIVNDDDDWVFATVQFGRTAYAMLRTTVAATPDWHTPDTIPSGFTTKSSRSSIQVKRLQRQCTVESTPHLHHALSLGIRLVVGLDYYYYHCCCRKNNNSQQQQQPAHQSSCSPSSPSPSLSYMERHVLVHWSRIATECSSSSSDNKDWIAQAWKAGPNHALHNLDDILQCPVYNPEIVRSLTPLSHPEQPSLSEQIRQQLLLSCNNNNNNGIDDDDEFGTVPPPPDQVDDEEWMWFPDNDDELLRRHQRQWTTTSSSNHHQSAATHHNNRKPTAMTDPTTTTAALDDMLSGVQTFLKGQSSVEGVATAATDPESNNAIQINPTVFLNLLHTTLQCKSADELSSRIRGLQQQQQQQQQEEHDPFFSAEDYELMEPNDTSGSDDDDEEEDGDDVNMRDLMNAMDHELKSSATASRTMDYENEGDGEDIFDDDKVVAQDAHVLSNLLKSLDAGAGGPGPIKNILNEMEAAESSNKKK